MSSVAIRLHRVLRGFSEGSRLDWLHPSNGPFPDFAAQYSHESGLFEVLAWDGEKTWVTTVCGPPNYHSGIPKSYRWWRGGCGTFWCRVSKGEIYDAAVHSDSIDPIVRQLAASSVRVHILTDPWPDDGVTVSSSGSSTKPACARSH